MVKPLWANIETFRFEPVAHLLSEPIIVSHNTLTMSWAMFKTYLPDNDGKTGINTSMTAKFDL